MFYQIRDNLTEIEFNDIDDNYITVGYIDSETLKEIGLKLGFSHSSINSCQMANEHFRSGVEVYDDYTFTELKIADPFDPEKYDCVALYIKKNLIIVVDVEDSDGSTKNKFFSALNRYSAQQATPEKIMYAFIDALIVNDFKHLELRGNEISLLEENVLKDDVDEDFNLRLLYIKKTLLTMHNYYEQLFDIAEALEENENDIFESEDLRYMSNIANKIIRLREDTDSLSSQLTHLQDAYSSFLDLKLNNTMKIFTVITSIFFPLTLIVGWYGMNFQTMPEFTWKYGYLFVIVLSAVVVSTMLIIGKKKKWF